MDAKVNSDVLTFYYYFLLPLAYNFKNLERRTSRRLWM